MDFWSAIAGVSPVLLVALAATFAGARSRLPRWLLSLVCFLAAAPAVFVLVLSLTALRNQAIGTWQRDLALTLVEIQAAGTVGAIATSLLWGLTRHQKPPAHGRTWLLQRRALGEQERTPSAD